MNLDREPNIGHSVYYRLLAFARKNGLDFTFVLQRYAMERLLYRMSISSHAATFVLKGASLFLVWKKHSFRVTKDADFLAYGFFDERQLSEIFRDICVPADETGDGLLFDIGSISARAIREEQEYGGIRITLITFLHSARIPLQVDIGFGDAVTPSPETVTYPSILGHPGAQLRAYTRYSVVAEKFEAMIQIGIANSRMKDFYDIWLISRLFDFDFVTLSLAVTDTFNRRKTDIPHSVPVALSEQFWNDDQKRTQWAAFIRKSKPEAAEPDLENLVRNISRFLLPVIQSDHTEAIPRLYWPAGGPWQPAGTQGTS